MGGESRCPPSSSHPAAAVVGRQAPIAVQPACGEESAEDEAVETDLLVRSVVAPAAHRGARRGSAEAAGGHWWSRAISGTGSEEDSHCERRAGHSGEPGEEEELAELGAARGSAPPLSPTAAAAAAVVGAAAAAGAREAGGLQTWALVLVAGHALSASLLLVVNKWALHVFPFVWVLTTLQFIPAALVVGLAGASGAAEVDSLRGDKLAAFLPAAGMFFITMTAGNAVVKSSNVDTFIVMRSLVPIPCAFLESLALGEPCPRPASWLGLAVLLAGALTFAEANDGLAVRSGSWMLLFLVMMPIDAVLIKHLINTLGLTPWGLVLYQNLLAGCLGILCTFAMELSSVQDLGRALHLLGQGGVRTWLPVSLSIVLGISLSFFQMNVRRVVSSTAFTVLGVSNKLLALLISQLALEAHSNRVSVASVLVSICGAVVFQQTVKGKGIAQAPRPKGGPGGGAGGPGASAKVAFGAMLLGLAWAGALSARESKA